MTPAQRVAALHLRRADSRLTSLEAAVESAKSAGTPEAWRALAYQFVTDYAYTLKEFAGSCTVLAARMNEGNVAMTALRTIGREPWLDDLEYIPGWNSSRAPAEGLRVLLRMRKPLSVKPDMTAVEDSIREMLTGTESDAYPGWRKFLRELPAIERLFDRYFKAKAEYRDQYPSWLEAKQILYSAVLELFPGTVRRELPTELQAVLLLLHDAMVGEPTQKYFKPVEKEVNVLLRAAPGWG